jgi:AraC-like DNA-binding protein
MVVRNSDLENANLPDLETLQRLGRARDFIDHCYDHPLNLDQISEKACFSRYHFLRLFRRAFNKTPHQYLIERRIEKAKELLASDELRVTDVCFEVGFQSLGSFSSLFHKCVGHAPVTFREKAREKQVAKRQVPGCFLVMCKLETA